MNASRPSVSTITNIVGGVHSGSSDPVIEHLLIDSRSPTVEDALFIALKGPRHNGHRYINDLYERGIRNFIVSDPVDEKLLPEANVIRVPDTLVALQALAAWHRSHFTIPVIGITGSNGKTIVKEWLFQLLHHDERILRSPGSWNSQVGVPLSVWQLNSEHTLAIFEAGISQPDEMKKLEPIVRPTIGVLTNINEAHDAGFRGDHAFKLREKSELFRRCDTVIHTDDRSGLFNAMPSNGRIATNDPEATFNVIRTSTTGDSCTVEIGHKKEAHLYRIPFSDGASIANATTCIAVLLHLGKRPSWINERLAQLTPVDMRLRTMQGIHGTTLIDDSYSNDRSSLAVALDHQQRTAHGRDLVVLISDIAESDRDPETLYSEVADLITRHKVREIIGVGPLISSQKACFPTGARFYPNTDDLLTHEDPKHFAGSVVLIKGARSFTFERVVQRWQEQVHGTELEIDLEAVRHNLNHYRARLGPGVRVMAMVKAFGYGAGALELARLFQHEQVHYLGVAYADEGIALRQHGITLPIMVMNPEPVALETLHRFRLEAEAYDHLSLQEAIQAQATMPSPVHLKLDTGMHRLGFTETDLPELLNALRGTPLEVASILSHLVASEDPSEDDFTRGQIASFTRMADAICDVLGYRPFRHIANTGAIDRWPTAHFDMVRLGIGLHGIGADAQETAKLQHTATLRTPIAQLKQLRAGDTVGYGRRGIITGERTIATLPLGYADGYSRKLGNGVGCIWVNGRPARTVGNICMDMCMVDVTDIPCRVGDTAVVFDTQHPVTDLARSMETIPYEVLTSISQRVKRVYVRG